MVSPGHASVLHLGSITVTSSPVDSNTVPFHCEITPWAAPPGTNISVRVTHPTVGIHSGIIIGIAFKHISHLESTVAVTCNPGTRSNGVGISNGKSSPPGSIVNMTIVPVNIGNCDPVGNATS